MHEMARHAARRERAECVPYTIHLEMWVDRIRPGESIAKASSALVGERQRTVFQDHRGWPAASRAASAATSHSRLACAGPLHC